MRTLVIHPKDKTTDFLKPIYQGRDFTVITGGCSKEDVAKAIDEHDHIIMMGHGTPQGLLAVGQFNGKPKYTAKPSTAIRNGGHVAVTGGRVKEFYGSNKSLLDDLPDADDFDFDNEDDWFSDRKVGGGNKTYTTTYTSGFSGGYVIDDSNAEQLRSKKLTAIWCNADQFMEWNSLDGFYTGMFISDTSEARMIGTADTEQWQVDQQNYKFAEVVGANICKEPEVLHAALMRYYAPLANRNAVAKYNVKRMFCHKNSEPKAVTA